MKSYWKDGMSIDETKTSILILWLSIFLTATLISLFKNGEIPFELIEISKTLIYSIAGVNVANKISSSVSRNKENNKGKV
ncbi:MAG: hypothetical protein K9L56_13215 [Clostridiales bacterium]|nr:hypothetical protein [Clostridiales bacterium]